MPLSPVGTYTGPEAGALFNQAGWANTTETNRFPRTGWPGPEQDFEGGVASANRCMHWIGSGPYTLQMIPSNNSLNNGFAWGHIVYPLQSIRTDLDWEIAIDVTLGNTPYTNKPSRIGMGLCRSPIFAGRRQTTGQDGSAFTGINGFGPLDNRFTVQFRPQTSTGSTATAMVGATIIPLSTGTGYQQWNSSSTSAAGTDWANGVTRVLRARYTASNQAITISSAGTIIVNNETTSAPLWSVYNLTTKNLVGNQGFPFLWFSTVNTGLLQGITVNEWACWGTFGNLVLPRTGFPTTGATAAVDTFDRGMDLTSIPVTKITAPSTITIYRPQVIVIQQPPVKLAKPSRVV